MEEHQNNFETLEQAALYVEDVRLHYREDHGEYRGARSEEQQLIAEVTSEEARAVVNGAAMGVFVLLSGRFDQVPNPEDSPVKLAGFEWKDFRGEFERLLVGFAVITNRMERDKHGVLSYANMREGDRTKVASVLLSDFLRHNALRFGVETAGLRKFIHESHHTDDGEIERTVKIVDKDKAQTQKELVKNIGTRGYSTGVAAHPAAKISPEEYLRLRTAYPEIDKDKFDRDISFYRDVRAKFEERE